MTGEPAYFHFLRRGSDAGELLDPEQQYSTPWGEPREGPCDKCGGTGRCLHRCLSCIEEAPSTSCPACSDKVHYEDVCPTCEGTGEITRTVRKGVSVFPTLAGLHRYLAERDVDQGDGKIIELRGELSGDRDLDADEGALLLLPREIVAEHALDARQLRR
jgi:hypothetical protein